MTLQRPAPRLSRRSDQRFGGTADRGFLPTGGIFPLRGCGFVRLHRDLPHS